MSIAIYNARESSGGDIYYDPEFRQIYEDHLPLLLATPGAATITIEPAIAYKYRYDFYGLLAEKGISEPLRWPTLRLNGYRNPMEYDGLVIEIKMVHQTSFEDIVNLFNSRYRTK